MGRLKIERVISVSSEDPLHPATNLLKTEFNNKKWKCKSAGEKNAAVILQLEQASVINGIDVGNEGSAFIEILVQKSSMPDSDFRVLLVTSTLMTLQQSKNSSNVSNVVFYKENNLCKPEAEEKWDRVKIVVSQPFNKHIQYGLSFIVFHGSGSSTEVSSSSIPLQVPASKPVSPQVGPSPSPKQKISLGRFSMIADDDQDDIGAGSYFARRKQIEEADLKAAAAIRAATASLTSGTTTSMKPPPKPKVPKVNKNSDTPKKNLSSPKAASPKISPVPSTSKRTPEVSKASDDHETEQKLSKKHKRDRGDGGLTNGSLDQIRIKKNALSLSNDLEGSTKLNLVNKVQRSNKIIKKPFSKLMEGVVFVISGFQNPLRGEIRNKALQMGAKYRADWDSTCTHLICAFKNTPKFNQVKGVGKIVKKEWIEECHEHRKRIPWRRFALDDPDLLQPDSEDEIVEDVPGAAGPSRDLKRPVHHSDSGEDTEDEIKMVRAKQKGSAKKRKKVPGTSPEPPAHQPEKYENSTECESPLPLAPCDEFYNADTVDENGAESEEPDFPLPYLPELLSDMVFYVADDVSLLEAAKLRRYIIAHKGTLESACTNQVEYVISEDENTIKELKHEFPSIVGVRPEWVWRTHDENRLLPTSSFEL